MPPRHHPRRSPKLPIRSQLIDGMGVNRPDVSLGRCLMWSLSRTRRSRAAGSGGFFGPPTLHRGPDEPQCFADHRRRNPLYRKGFRCNYTFGTGTLIWTAVTFGCILISVTTMKPIARLMSNMVLTFAMISCAFAVVPQMLVSIYGSNLAVQTATANALPLTTQLGGTAVAFNGIAAPLLYVSSEQINAQVPSGVRGSASANVVVTTAVGKSSAFSMPVNSGSAPGSSPRIPAAAGRLRRLTFMPDGSTTPKTPHTNFDPHKDAGLAIFMTGLGFFFGSCGWGALVVERHAQPEHPIWRDGGSPPRHPGWLSAVAANINQASA